MARCEICSKDLNNARKISITRSQVSRRAKVKQKANVKRVRVVVKGVPQRMNVCTRCLRSGALENLK